MIMIAAFVGGAGLGARLAKKRGGNRLDIAHYATGFAVAFGLLSLFVIIFLERIAA
ncbi:hypothetical protein [Roseivivax sediminis]|uniref:PEP-CTERM protein-sorting domain-containing protein n=1 Tax=Roseivivax sediminis TaxID=936889 RepID=A0A1I2E3Y4_9RHOB|nr:hypothetical protein [Roseivivax sediminis]SFE87248.1 hypothetical protein SAMN04515678_12029 [Roseivivax sediminis]